MPEPYPTKEGFRAVLRDPALLLAELSWRWSYGLASLVLIFISLRELQHAVIISPTDELLLATMQPILVAEAWSHILDQALPLLARVVSILLPAISIMWIAAATFGRAITIKRLVERFSGGQGSSPRASGIRWGALVSLHFFRAALMLAVVLGYVGSALIASRFVRLAADAPSLDLALVVFVLCFSVVIIVATAINWVLAMAPIYVVREGHGTWESLGHAVQVFRARGSQLTAAATWNGFLRLAAACAAIAAGVIPLMFVGTAPGWVIWLLLGAITVVYVFVADLLLLARLAAYVFVVEQSRTVKTEVSS